MYILPLSIFTSATFAQQEQLVFSVDLIRHGDRTPATVLPKDPHIWPEGVGQLTATGMQQEYQLGLQFHKNYVDSKLLSANYSSGEVYIRSTDVDRTLMSAESVLMGLYPLGTGPKLPDGQMALPSGYQPLPIHTVSSTEDPLVINYNASSYITLLNKYVFSRDDWKQKTAQLQPQFARWSDLTGIQINDLTQLIGIGDTLYIEQLYNVPFPAGMTTDEAKTIIDAGRWAFTTEYLPPEIGDAVGKNALNLIYDYINQFTQQKSKVKFVLLSAHDSTILAVLSAMHTPALQPPHYASDLNFSVYQAGQTYTVKVTYNGQPISIPACGETACSASQFGKMVEK
jgi:acid phosphatase